MVRRTKEEALATRHSILDAAERVFLQQGVSRTSLHDIAQAAGVTRGAIYWHFQDKADVFNAMMERVTMPMEEAAARTDDPAVDDPLAYARESFTEVLRKVVNDPQTRRVFEVAMHKVEYVEETAAVRDRHLSARNECLSHFERGMKIAMERGLVSRRIPARAAALGLVSLFDGLLQNWMLDPNDFDLLRVGQQTLDAYLAGITRPKSAV